MINAPIKIPKLVHDLLQSLLRTGKIEYEGKSVDFSPVQTITIKDKVLTFNPPPKVQVTVMGINIKTTISSITAKDSGIHVEVDNSPVDLELKPNELG